MQTVTWQTSETGALLGADIRGAAWIGMAYAEGGLLRLRLRTKAGPVLQFTMEDVREITVTDMSEDAAVFGINVWRAEDAPAVPEGSFGGWNALLSPQVDAPGLQKEARRIAARQPDALLFVLRCTRGSVAAIVSALTISAEQ